MSEVNLGTKSSEPTIELILRGPDGQIKRQDFINPVTGEVINGKTD